MNQRGRWSGTTQGQAFDELLQVGGEVTLAPVGTRLACQPGQASSPILCHPVPQRPHWDTLRPGQAGQRNARLEKELHLAVPVQRLRAGGLAQIRQGG